MPMQPRPSAETAGPVEPSVRVIKAFSFGSIRADKYGLTNS